MTSFLSALVYALGGFAGAVLGYALGSVSPPPSPRLGRRGACRRAALEAGGAFTMIEPAIRYLAGALAPLPLDGARRRVEHHLQRSGYFWGLTADEGLALALMSAGAFGAIGAALALATDQSPVIGAPAASFGASLPYLHASELARERAKAVTRSLPHAIEIVAMCMGAGLDFPGALRKLAQPVGAADREPLAEEFAAILEELELGHTRSEALQSFAHRVPTEPVRDFVNAVVQAERKGNPLARVLQVQGRMLNVRRSVLAEEAAARAGVLMIVPMVFLVGCILLLLIGPFLVKGIGF